MHRFFTFGLLLLVLHTVGCSTQAPPAPSADETDYEAAHVPQDHRGHDHSHESLGPHEGHVIELGDEEFHVEWLHDDDTGLVSLFVLDAAMQQDVEIQATSISIDYRIGEKPHHHDLTAVTTAAVEAGSTHFETTDKSLIEALKMAGQGVDATVSAEINGKVYTASFGHQGH